MNKHVNELSTIEVDLPRQIDDEVASDIEKESVFVSPMIERIVITEDRKHAVVKLRAGVDADPAEDHPVHPVDAPQQRRVHVRLERVRPQLARFPVDDQRGVVGPQQHVEVAHEGGVGGLTLGLGLGAALPQQVQQAVGQPQRGPRVALAPDRPLQVLVHFPTAFERGGVVRLGPGPRDVLGLELPGAAEVGLEGGVAVPH